MATSSNGKCPLSKKKKKKKKKKKMKKKKKRKIAIFFFLSISLNICFGCSKEPSHRDGSFEYPQHMFWLRSKKNNFQVCTLIWGPEFALFTLMDFFHTYIYFLV